MVLKNKNLLSYAWANLQFRDRLNILKDTKKTVWIFGAGASLHYNLNSWGVPMPLANGFFKALHSVPTSHGLHAHIGPLLSYLKNYRGVPNADAAKWTPNIEDFMTSVESDFNDLSNRVSSLTKNEYMRLTSLSTVYSNMTFLFANVVNEIQNGPVASCYTELLRFCGPKDTFVTFNWDTLLDAALAATGCWSPNWGYGIKFDGVFDGDWKTQIDHFETEETEWNILKLHGSTNWLIPYVYIDLQTYKSKTLIPENKVFLFWQANLPFQTHRGRWRGGYVPLSYGYYPPNIRANFFREENLAVPEGHVLVSWTPISTNSPFKEPYRDGIPSSPFLITPVRQKRYEDYNNKLNLLWERAEQSLASADRIVAIGYSFPSTDTRPLELIRNTLLNRKDQIEFVIVDPAANDVARRIGEELKNAKTITSHNMKFEKFIEVLWDEAPEIMREAAIADENVKNWLSTMDACIKASVSSTLSALN